MLVLTHFIGHSNGGFGGSMKNIAIGRASGQLGKRQVHGTACREINVFCFCPRLWESRGFFLFLETSVPDEAAGGGNVGLSRAGMTR
ncbi:MAG: DUF362 domain-containing protein [Desulfovibrio sp.]|nr:DUF362 domain-containing protein [Desulfovibrio sp.]